MAACLTLGQAGVYRVMAELLLRGHRPYIPAVDDHGVDLALSTGVRIQVKTARLHTRKNWPRKPIYHLTFGWAQIGRTHIPIRRKKNYSSECDFLIIYGVDENRFWIVPSFLLDGRTCLMLGPRCRVVRGQIEELLDVGVTRIEAARKLGVDRHTITRRLKGEGTKNGGFVRSVRMCEDQWGLLGSPVFAPFVGNPPSLPGGETAQQKTREETQCQSLSLTTICHTS